MSLTEYDEEEVRRDFIEEGREIGIAEGSQQKAVEAAINLLKMNVLSEEQIAQAEGLPLEQVLELKQQISVQL